MATLNFPSGLRAGLWCRALAVLVALAQPFPAVRAAAEDAPEEAGQEQAPRVDARAQLVALRLELEAAADPPREPGVDGALAEAHRLHVKPRLARLGARLKEVDSDRLWVAPAPAAPEAAAAPGGPQEPGPLAASWLRPDQWIGVVHRLASASTEMAQIIRGYRKVAVSGADLERRWLRAHPEPSLTGLTPAGSQALRVERLIRWYLGNGKQVPASLYLELERWRSLEIQQLAQRESEHRAWQASRAAAMADIEAAVAATRQAVALQLDLWVERMDRLRGVVAAAQLLEEVRLAALLAPTGEPRTQALAALADLATGRARVLAAPEDPVTEWATRIRQLWLAPRAALLASKWLREE